MVNPDFFSECNILHSAESLIWIPIGYIVSIIRRSAHGITGANLVTGTSLNGIT
jgi:hypothetical protein